ncbi:MAG: hypothetical protein ACYC0X_13360 [Pirellulaceae bacterium]
MKVLRTKCSSPFLLLLLLLLLLVLVLVIVTRNRFVSPIRDSPVAPRFPPVLLAPAPPAEADGSEGAG